MSYILLWEAYLGILYTSFQFNNLLRVLEFWIYIHNSRLHFGAILQSYSISSILMSTYSSRVCTLQVLYSLAIHLVFPVPNPLSEHVPELLTIIQHRVCLVLILLSLDLRRWNVDPVLKLRKFVLTNHITC
jgi:hypothetical protein